MNAALEARAAAAAAYFPPNTEALARLCSEMADRFLAGGRLLAFGITGQARSDVRHVAVEFVHPVIVGKRALPAIGLTDAAQLALLAEPSDIVMVFGEPGDGPAVRSAVQTGIERGCLTVGFGPLEAPWTFAPPSRDPFIRQELIETTYHVLWELVHIFFEHQGRHTETAGASSFLYPFLAEREYDREAVIEDVRRSVAMKAEEVLGLRGQTLIGSAQALSAAADAIRSSSAAGGRLLALGNGGSATDAMDLVADCLAAGLPAIDLTEDPSIITAIANDIGPEAIFARQVIAYGRPGDVLVALSTSGNSLSVTAALREAARRGLRTVAFSGYDGGQVAAEGLAEHLIVSPSQYIPRIQEAQASAYHVLLELVAGDVLQQATAPVRLEV